MTGHQHDDADLAARLRQATETVPASSLELDAVLTSARRRSRRARTAMGLAVVLMIGLGGAGVWQLVPGDRTLGPGPAAPASPPTSARACQPDSPLEVSIDDVSTMPDDLTEVWAVTFTDGVPHWAPVMRYDDEISGLSIRATSHTAADGSRADRAELHLPDRVMAEVEQAARASEELVGFPPAGRPGPSGHPDITWPDGPPVGHGNVLFFRGGERVGADVVARCGGETFGLRLEYTVADEGGTLSCGIETPTDSLGDLVWHVALTWCPWDQLPETTRAQYETSPAQRDRHERWQARIAEGRAELPG